MRKVRWDASMNSLKSRRGQFKIDVPVLELPGVYNVKQTVYTREQHTICCNLLGTTGHIQFVLNTRQCIVSQLQIN